jgi:hypothetical protein
MRVKAFRFLLISSLLLQGCGAFKTMEMAAVTAPEQQEGYRGTITSQKKHFVSMAPYREHVPPDGNTSFILFVKNCGEAPIDISNQNISAEFIGNDPEWSLRDIAVLSPDDLLRTLELQQWRNTVAAKSAIRTQTYYTYDTDGNITGSYTQSIVEPGYQYAAESANRASDQIRMVKELVLQRQSLQPGAGASGLIICDTSDMNARVEGDFHMVVSVDGEQHDFTFTRRLR